MIRPDCYFCVRHAASEGEAHTCLVRVHENTVEPGIRTLPQVKMAIRALAEIEQAIPYGPLLPCDDKAPYCAFRPAGPAPGGPPLERPARERPLVLVVDDDKPTLELLRDILASRKIEAVTATSGFEGLELAQERRPDLVILDVMMPGLDGYRTCAFLKEDPDLKGVPVLMCTAAGGAKFNERAFRAGAAFCLAKPFEAHRFLGLVELALSKTKGLPYRDEVGRRRRVFRRLAARYPVTARATGGTAHRREVAGFTENISAGGLLCNLPERFPVMTPVLLRVETPAGPVALTVTVTWCGPSSARHTGDIPHGLRILQAWTPEDAARWTEVLRTLENAAGPEAGGEA